MTQIYEVDWTMEQPMRESIVNAVDLLHEAGWTIAGSSTGMFDKRFQQLQACEVTATAFTPAMCRMFYELGHAIRPRRVVGLGTYCGTAFNLLVAGAIDGMGSVVEALGIDIDGEATVLARKNAARMGLNDVVEYRHGDGLDYLATRQNRPSIDLLYLDLDDPDIGKADYARAFDLVANGLADKAFVLAHDALVPKFRVDVLRLHERVREAGFGLIMDVPVDRAGLFVAARNNVRTYRSVGSVL